MNAPCLTFEEALNSLKKLPPHQGLEPLIKAVMQRGESLGVDREHMIDRIAQVLGRSREVILSILEKKLNSKSKTNIIPIHRNSRA